MTGPAAPERSGAARPDGGDDGDRGGADTATGADAAPILHLPAFDGPLDLLLHLIERRELDVVELSVLAVAEQYMEQLRAAESINLGALADFVAMGARLLLLKSRALLPGGDEPAETLDGADGDGAAIVAALQEYQRYRHAADDLRRLEDERRTGYRRDAAPPAMPLPTGLEQVTVDALVTLFREVMERVPAPEDEPEVAREPVRLAERVAALVSRLERERRLSFRGLMEGARSRLEVIVDFLAVLELIKARFLEARQSEAFGDIELTRREGAEAPSAQDVAGGTDRA